MSSVNFWLESVVDAYILACAQGHDRRAAVAEAERAAGCGSQRILTRKDLAARGLRFSRQHLHRRIKEGTFPAGFQLPSQNP